MPFFGIKFEPMEPDRRDGRHQNTRRIAAALDCLAADPDNGARLIDVCKDTGLGKGTVHRILAGLVDSGLAQHDAGTGRFFVGPRIVGWALSSHRRFGLAEQLKAVLDEICNRCADTVYLAVRQVDEAIYVARREGAYPLKALPVEVGARRPLGIGAAPTAILAFQPEGEIERIVGRYGADRLRFDIGDALLRELVARAQALGYSLHQGEVLPGMIAVGVPVMNADGRPVAAISVAAAADRLPEKRREEVVAIMREVLAGHPVLV